MRCRLLNGTVSISCISFQNAGKCKLPVLLCLASVLAFVFPSVGKDWGKKRRLQPCFPAKLFVADAAGVKLWGKAAVPVSHVPWALWDYGDSDRQRGAAECAGASPVIGSAWGPAMLRKDKTTATDKLVRVQDAEYLQRRETKQQLLEPIHVFLDLLHDIKENFLCFLLHWREKMPKPLISCGTPETGKSSNSRSLRVF